MVKLDPSYDGCPTSCTRPERDQRRGCPDCEVTRLYEECLEDLRAAMADAAEEKGLPRWYRWPWTLQKILQDVGAVGAMDARVNGEGYDGGWTVPQRRLVSILREERASLRRSKDLEFRRKHKLDG